MRWCICLPKSLRDYNTSDPGRARRRPPGDAARSTPKLLHRAHHVGEGHTGTLGMSEPACWQAELPNAPHGPHGFRLPENWGTEEIPSLLPRKRARKSFARVAAQICTDHWRSAVFLSRIDKRRDGRWRLVQWHRVWITKQATPRFRSPNLKAGDLGIVKDHRWFGHWQRGQKLDARWKHSEGGYDIPFLEEQVSANGSSAYIRAT